MELFLLLLAKLPQDENAYGGKKESAPPTQQATDAHPSVYRQARADCRERYAIFIPKK